MSPILPLLSACEQGPVVLIIGTFGHVPGECVRVE